MYEYIMNQAFISNQTYKIWLSTFISNQTYKIWLSTKGTIHDFISCIFSMKNIFELNPGSNPRPLGHEADTA